MKLNIVFWAVLFLLAGCQSALKKSDSAPGARWTVSGLSAGGYMATQLHVTHSARISGAAALAAGPYDCAQASIARALGPCLTGSELGSASSETLARSRSSAAEVDDLTNLRNDPVWLFHSSADTVVHRPATQALYEFYSKFTAEDLVTFVTDIRAAHGMPTLSAGASCGEMTPPFVNACGFDAAGEILNHLHELSSGPKAPDKSRLFGFDQTCCSTPNTLLAEAGFVYQPSACESHECDIHMVLHGCRQGAEIVKRQFIEQAGYLRWAEGNDLILIFPQVAASLTNPAGCWDWWGYTGANYATRSAPQIQALMAMFEHFSTRLGEP